MVAAAAVAGGATARIADVVDLGATVRSNAADAAVDTTAGVATRADGGAEGPTFRRSAIETAVPVVAGGGATARMAAVVDLGATVRSKAADAAFDTTAGVATSTAGAAEGQTV